MPSNRDKLNTREQAHAAVSRDAVASDVLMLRGRFDAVCVGPIEERRDEYVRLRDALEEAKVGGDIPTILALQAEIDAVPMEEKWRDVVKNLVTTLGKNDLLDKYLKGSTYTQTFRMGLKGVGVADVADTQASHGTWNEVGLANAPAYTGNRKDVVMGSAAAGSSVSPVQAFAMTSGGTVAGCFTNNGGSATKDNTTGVLFSAGDFTGGNKVVANGDTVNVTYTLGV